MSRWWAGGSTRAWRKTRAAVLAENLENNGGRCRLAIRDVCAGLADCVHHTRGRAAGHDPRFLVAACTPCNLKAGDPTRAPAYDPPGRGMTRW